MNQPKSMITYVRLTPEQRTLMDAIVRQSGIGNLSDHLRRAVDEYTERHAPQARPGPTETK